MPASKKKLDFRGVKDRSGFRLKHFPEGDYKAKVIDVDDHESTAGNEGWVFTIQVKNGKFPYYCMTEKNQLWKIRNLFLAAGMNVPKKLLAVDPNKVVGKAIGVTLEDDEYEGRTRSVIGDVIPVSDLVEGDTEEVDEDDEEIEEEDDVEEEEDEEPEPPKKKKKTTKKKKADDDEDEEVDDEELEELEVEEL